MRAAPLATLLLALAAPLSAGPTPQLANTVVYRAARYGIEIDAHKLTTAQAGALHTLFISERGYFRVRRRALAILRNPDFRD